METPRREFLKTTLAACAVAATSTLRGNETTPDSSREYYELRAYRLRDSGAPSWLERYLENALIPALASRNIGPVGVFSETSADPATAHHAVIWVVIPYPNVAVFASTAADLNRDAGVRQAAGDYFAATTKANPAFDRIDTSLLLAFAGQPKLQLPQAHTKPTRVFELRTYDSFSEAKALAKIDMFNAGEIPVMREVGLSPVFYGQALAGRDLPHLSYMTSGPDMATHLEHWKAFGTHPTWLKLKNDPQYADTVSQITKRFLTPTAYSQI
jgi:hypothetical protein